MWNLCRAQCPASILQQSSSIFGISNADNTNTNQQQQQRFSSSSSSIKNDSSTLWSKKSSISRHLADSFDTFNQILSPTIDIVDNNNKHNLRYSKFDQPIDDKPLTTTKTPISIVNKLWNDNQSIIIDKQPNTKNQTTAKAETLTLSKEFGVGHNNNQLDSDQSKSKQQIINDNKMDNNNNTDSSMNRQTEYSRQYQWQLPMIDTKPVKQEPMMSQYQRSYGYFDHHNQQQQQQQQQQQHSDHPITSYSQPASLTNSYNSQYDVIDSIGDNNVNRSQKSLKSYQNAIVPGSAVRNIGSKELSLKSSKCQSSIQQLANENNDNSQQQHQQQQPSSSTTALSQPQQQMDSLKSCHSLFDFEPSPPPSTLTSIDYPSKSEYHSKFKDFNEYVYVEGDGFKKGDSLSLQAQQMAHSWFNEVTERSRQACKYRARSRNGATPVNPEYSWNGVPVKDRNDLAALALATRLVIEQKRSERNYSTNTSSSSRSASAKPHLRNSGQSSITMKMNSAPPSLQDDRSIGSKPRPVTRKPVTKTTTTTAATTNVKQSNVDRNNNNSKIVSSKTISVKKPPPSSTTAASNQASVDNGSKKIWIKPVKKPTANESESTTKTTKSIAANDSNIGKQREFDPEPKQVPLHTTQIKSPEQKSGIKSPSPESWKVTIEKGGLNWVNGGQTTTTTTAPVNFPDQQSLLQQQQQQNDQMVRPVPINGISRL